MLDPTASRKQIAESTFMGGVNVLSHVAAFILSAFTSPLIYKHTVGWVTSYITQMYGNSELSGLVSVVWFCVVSIAVWAFARASVATLLVAGGLTLAARLFA